MLICPYCYESLSEQTPRCPNCSQYLIDDCLNIEFPALDKKKCIYCGKQILLPAKICRFCHKWLDELNRIVNDLDSEDLV